MTIDNFQFAGKKAIVRVDFNVPLNEEGKITDDTRIRGALPTLKKVLADGGALIIMSHMGKPKGKVNAKYSLSQIVDAVAEKLGVPVQFAPDCAKAAEAAAALKAGEVLMLENLRFYPEEEGKPVGIDKEDPAYNDAKKAMNLQLLLPTISTTTTRCLVTLWRKRLRLLTTSSKTSSVLSPLLWVVQRYLQRLVSSRTLWTRLTTLSFAVV